MYEATLSIKRKDIKSLFVALEEEKNMKDRAIAKASIKDNLLIITVKAKDATSFRAVLNTYLRIISSTEKLQEV